jgi:hypothetical protein
MLPDRKLGLSISLAVLLAATTYFSVVAPDSPPLTRFGRPALVALAATLVLHGRAWARWLLLLLSLGPLFAGPIGTANGVRPATAAGAFLWVVSAACALALLSVFRTERPRDGTGLAGPESTEPGT